MGSVVLCRHSLMCPQIVHDPITQQNPRSLTYGNLIGPLLGVTMLVQFHGELHVKPYKSSDRPLSEHLILKTIYITIYFHIPPLWMSSNVFTAVHVSKTNVKDKASV